MVHTFIFLSCRNPFFCCMDWIRSSLCCAFLFWINQLIICVCEKKSQISAKYCVQLWLSHLWYYPALCRLLLAPVETQRNPLSCAKHRHCQKADKIRVRGLTFFLTGFATTILRKCSKLNPATLHYVEAGTCSLTKSFLSKAFTAVESDSFYSSLTSKRNRGCSDALDNL